MTPRSRIGRVAARDGVRLHAEAHGDGVPLIFSCGYCQTHENFRPQVEPLVAAGARVILWDLRGHGRSDAPEAPEAYTMDAVVDDLDRVLEWAVPGAPAVVGGLSFGGLASLHHALAHPERVLGLLLIDTGPGFKNEEAQARWLAQVERTASRLETSGCERLLTGRAVETSIGRRPELPAAQAAARAIAAQDPHALARFGRRVAGPAKSVIDDLPRLRAPALVLVGEEDAAYLRAADVMTAKLPNARKHVLPGAGHVCNIEQSDAFNRVVAEFLAQLAAS